MKFLVTVGLMIAGILLAGCHHLKPKSTASGSAPVAAVVTPDNSLAGKVVSYNSVGRFVVLNFAARQMPHLDQNLFLYRSGLKVAEVRVTGPQNEGNIVADLISGDAKTGDEVRDR